MSTKAAVRQDGISVIGDNKLLFDVPHWTFGDTEGLSLANFWSTIDAGSGAKAPAFHLLELPTDATAGSFQLDGFDDHQVYAAGGGDNGGLDSPTIYASSIPIVDYVNDLKTQIDNAFPVDEEAYHFTSLPFDVSGGSSFAAGWLDAASGPPPVPFQAGYVPADVTGNFSDADGLAGFATDAKSGGGGSPGGGGGGGGGGKPGGGGGGGSGLLTIYTSGDPNVDNANEFNIQIDFSGSWTAKQQAIVTWAADTWSQIITGDVHDDTDLNGNLVDDIVISVSAGRIDGNGSPLFGNVLAQTGNIVVRDPGTVDQWLPLTASITLDSTDLKNSTFADAWDDIILHEMGHALGFVGAIFDQLGLVDSFNFTGTNAMAAYGGFVPLEDGGGSGTVGSHWDETTFAPNGDSMSNELMTGYFIPGEQTYLSDTTVGALADLGYTVHDPSVGSYLVVDSHLLTA